MRWLTFTIVLAVATLLEAGNLLNWMAVSGWYIRPSLLVTLLVYYAVTGRSAEAISFAFLIGLAADLAAGLLGPHMLSYGVTGLLLHSAGHTLSIRRATHKALIVLGVFVVTEIGAYWLSLLKTGEARPHVYSALLLTGVYSAVISPLVWSVLSSLSGWSGIRREKTRHLYH